jgi:cyclin H
MAERVSFDELYRRSTQYRVWSFTRQGLAIQRQAVNEKGQRKVDERLASMPEVDATMVEKVTVREELQLISFHARSIGKLANFFNMPSQVRVSIMLMLDP